MCFMAVHMNRLVILLFAICGAVARAEGIGDVLERSQQQRLDGFVLADPQAPATQRVRQGFEALVKATGLKQPVELRVVTGDVVAETIQGRVIVANQSLGDLGEGPRLFVLAHEIGHVALKHWPKMTLLYQAWLPGELVQTQTDAVAALLGRDASALAYRQEFEADGFALQTLCAMGHAPSEIMTVFDDMGSFDDGPTHPGTGKRVAALREALPGLAGSGG
jgi:Zn-dependent protease with chaperone function